MWEEGHRKVPPIPIEPSYMRFRHLQVEYELPDEWWLEAGMQNFIPDRRAYVASASTVSNGPLLELAIDDLEPELRQGSHGVFNDSTVFGSARERVIHILRGFRENSALPPVEVSRVAADGLPRYKLIHGAHRTYCSIAAGFSHVPAVEVDDFFGTYPGS